MAELGTFTLWLAFAAAAWALVVAVAASRTGGERLLASAVGGLRAALLALSAGFGTLVGLFLTRDFSVEYVAQYSDRSLSATMTVAASWAGENGSLLLWAWMLAGVAVVAAAVLRRRCRELLPITVAVLAVVLLFFVGLVALTSNPFGRLDFVPRDGAGLNPMLMHWGQVVHPPATFLGYVGFVVPFALAVAALVTGRLDATWLRAARPWMVFGWLLLGIGIALGARWAYTELGWGGYWAWDPVENVSLLPWLTATVYLHTAILQERRGKLRVWNLAMAMTTFLLTIFATFLVRSGVASSVHAFAQSAAGVYFLLAIVVTVGLGAGLLTWRLPQLRHPRGAAVATVSRESLLVLTSVLVIAYTLAIFWGTLFPVLTQAVQGTEVSVGGPFFDAVSVPVGVLLLLLLGLGPLVAWRRASAADVRRSLRVPATVGLAAGGLAWALDGGEHPVTIVALALVALALTTLVIELSRGTVVARRQARNQGGNTARTPPLAIRRRLGAAVAHLGIVLLVLGLAVDGTYRSSEDIELAVGETARFAGYDLTLLDIDTEASAARTAITATLGIARGGSSAGTLSAERYLEGTMEQPRTEVGVRSLMAADLYVILGDVDVEGDSAVLDVNYHPGVLWLWVGATLALLGGLMTIVAPGPRSHLMTARTGKVQPEPDAPPSGPRHGDGKPGALARVPTEAEGSVGQEADDRERV